MTREYQPGRPDAYRALGMKAAGKTAVKISSGEPGEAIISLSFKLIEPLVKRGKRHDCGMQRHTAEEGPIPNLIAR